MRLRSRFWSSWFRALVLAVVVGLGAATLSPAGARADGSDQPPAKNERVVEIGPQAVIIVNERGEKRMYDDPSQQVPTCTSKAACLGTVLGVLAAMSLPLVGNVTRFVEQTGQGGPPPSTPPK